MLPLCWMMLRKQVRLYAQNEEERFLEVQHEGAHTCMCISNCHFKPIFSFSSLIFLSSVGETFCSPEFLPLCTPLCVVTSLFPPELGFLWLSLPREGHQTKEHIVSLQHGHLLHFSFKNMAETPFNVNGALKPKHQNSALRKEAEGEELSP